MIRPKLITIVRAEGPIALCDRPETATSWPHANAILFRWSATAPEHGGYDKCDFKVEFENGETYDGRYDLVHWRKEHPNLARHVRSYLRYLAGELPLWAIGDKEAETRVRRHQQSLDAETVSAAKRWLETYDLGQ